MSRDERIIRRAMELFELATRDDGQCPFNWPTRGTQEGFTYTLCCLAMYGDYVMNHTDFAWLRARHPHPQGWIAVDLAFDGGKVSGSVTTPVAGEFRYGGKVLPLKPGANEIRGFQGF